MFFCSSYLFLLCCTLFIVEKSCDEMRTWDDIKANTTSTVFGTYINYTCVNQPAELYITYTSYCNHNGEWTPSIRDCESTYRNL